MTHFAEYRMRRLMGCAMVALLLAVAPLHAEDEPVGLMLSWVNDPTTTMVVDWHTAPGQRPLGVVHHRLEGEEEWIATRASQRRFPFSPRIVHRTQLTKLEPDTMYEFRVGDFERIYKFRTMPTDLNQPLVFATGGDTMIRNDATTLKRTNRVALQYDPAFIAWGGDLSYADEREENVAIWHRWFEANRDSLITEEGRVVPIVVAIGNHEVRNHYWYRHDGFVPNDAWRRRLSPYFHVLFAYPGLPGYNTLDFGNYLTLVMLDTDHNNPVVGEQTRWLHNVLEQRQHVTHIFPIYHVPAYPSQRDYDNRTVKAVRDNWCPLFEQYGIRVAFENHDHTYKRTKPIRNEEVHPEGVVYIGDGAWGVETRQHFPVDSTWYLEKAQSIRHAIIVTLHGEEMTLIVVSEDGEIIDQFPEPETK